MSTQWLYDAVGFALVTADLPRLCTFYTTVLGFDRVGHEQPSGLDEMAVLKLTGEGRRQVVALGEQLLTIDCFEARGAPYPAGSDAASLWFQHLALVVINIAGSFVRLRDISPVSTHGPETLPPSSGGVQAFKFRDPDEYPLELLQFPDDKEPAMGEGRFERRGQIGLGIDHSAASVANTDASAAFYRALRLQPGERTLNHGIEQQQLDDLRDVEVEVVPMKPQRGAPHLELLGYQIAIGARGRPQAPNDVAANRILWSGAQAQLLVDPDGHLQQVGA